MTSNEYLTYYKKYKIIPTIDIKDLNKKKLQSQRNSFYFLLGVSPNDLKNKSVLEFCPGTGYNGYYLLKYSLIKSIDMVELNHSSIQSIKKNLLKFKNKIKIYQKDIYNFKTKKKYDFVMIENALPGLKNSKKIVIKLNKLLKKDGIAIFTLTDDMGIFSEKLRYLVSCALIKRNKILLFEEKLSFLCEIFVSHLKKLNSNTRSINNWVLDNMLHVSWITKKKYFSLEDFIQCIKNKNFVINKVSPEFEMFQEWYKNFDFYNYNKKILKSYQKNQVNNLYYKFTNKKFKKNKDIIFYIKSINKDINKLNINSITTLDEKKFVRISNKLKILFDLLQSEINMTISEKSVLLGSIEEIIKFLKSEKKNFNFKKFKYFWGRGTTSVSLRNAHY